MGVRSINESAFQKEVIESNIPVVVDFSATWCGPCRALEPNLEALSKEYEGKVKFVRVDVDENQELAVQYGIRSVPTLLLFKNGEVINQLIGNVPKVRLISFVESAL